MEGKKYLADCLKSIGINTDLEVKIGWHICDVVAEKNGIKVPIEYQCSPITEEEFTDRHKSYDLIHYWILGTYYYNHANTFRNTEKKDKTSEPCWDPVSEEYEYDTYDYDIQHITEIEEDLEMVQPLLYLNDRTFYRANWNYRWKAKKLGWYNLRKVHEGHFLNLIRGIVDDE